MATRNRTTKAGGALLTTIVLSLVIAMLLSGVGAIAVSHFQRSATDVDYAAAIQAADAGINWQLRRISLDTSDQTLPCQIDAPCTHTIPGTNASFTVWITKEDGTGPWFAPDAGLMHSRGTVNGITRQVQIRGSKKSIFDEFAIFTVYYGDERSGLVFNGTNSVINGSVGSNSPVSPNAPGQVNGDLTLAGPYAQGSASGGNVLTEAQAVLWPTVDEIANRLFPGGGLAWLRTNNNNGNLKQYAVGDSNPDNAISAGFPTSGNFMYSLRTNNFNTLNQAPTGSPAEGLRTMIFPPGDYYFEEVSVTGSNAVVIDNRNGPVRIWVNTPPSGPSNDDNINANFYYLDPTPWKFRLYYNKCNTLTIGGTTTFYGGFYAWREGCAANSLPSFNFTGGSTIYGSVIGGTITVAGGTVINFPNDGGNAAGDDFSLWYGFKDNWKEVAIPGAGAVFADGTSN